MTKNAQKNLGVFYQKQIEQQLEQVDKQVLNHLFAQQRTHQLALGYMQALLSSIERKNSWQIAEQVGQSDPYGIQYLLGRARWNFAQCQEALVRYVIQCLGSSKNVLVLDETGFIKKGTHSVGVQRQYTGTTGKVDNCQIGVFLGYATPQGRALIDAQLYLPEEWLSNATKKEQGGIPSEVTFQTKPQIALSLLKKYFHQGHAIDWVTADAGYSSGELRGWLEKKQQPYAMGAASNYPVTYGGEFLRVKELGSRLKAKDWKNFSAGWGTKKDRRYMWAKMKVNSMSPQGWNRWLVLRRSLEDLEDIRYYLVFCPDTKSLSEIARVIGMRWTVEECFEMAKGEVGLDHYEVRSWEGWNRHVVLSMTGLAFLNALRKKLGTNRSASSLKKNLFYKKTPNKMQKFLERRGLIY